MAPDEFWASGRSCLARCLAARHMSHPVGADCRKSDEAPHARQYLMLASDQSLPEPTLALDLRPLARRAFLPVALVVGVAVVFVLVGGTMHAFAAALRRVLDLSPVWVAVGAGFECVSIAGYIALLAFVAGRATSRIGVRESAQIALTGAAATRLLPTAGAGGAAVTVWALRRAGLGAQAAAHTLITFFVLLYAAFLTAVAVAGTTLALGVVHSHGPLTLSTLPTVAAVLTIGLALALALRSRAGDGTGRELHGWGAKTRRAADIVGGAVRDALGLVRARDVRLSGAAIYWGLDAAVLWAMLHAFGSPPAIPVVALAYLIGQVANTVPLPGTVSGGMTGVLIAFGVSPALALPAVLAYRTIAVWLPTPAALVAAPGLRGTAARWARERSDTPERVVARERGEASAAAAGSIAQPEDLPAVGADEVAPRPPRLRSIELAPPRGQALRPTHPVALQAPRRVGGACLELV